MKKRKGWEILNDSILSYADLASQCGALFKQLDRRMGIDKTLKSDKNGNSAAVILCSDIMNAYNGIGSVTYPREYVRFCKSKNMRKRNQYQQRLYKDIIKMVRAKYDSGVTFEGVPLDSILEGLEMFWNLLK